MTIRTIPVGMLETNCYLVYDENKRGIVIDPGAEGDRLLAAIKGEGVRVERVLLTHVHYDHIQAVDDIQEVTGAELLVPRLEEPAFRDPLRNLLRRKCDLLADRLLDDGDTVEAGALSFQVMLTPGHTAGSCCYIGEGVIFAGDTLFAGDVGRTDLPSGSQEALEWSLAALAALPGDYRVYPGHGPDTTLERERRLNPYVRESMERFREG